MLVLDNQKLFGQAIFFQRRDLVDGVPQPCRGREGRLWPASGDGKVRPNFDSDKLWAELAQANLICFSPFFHFCDKKMIPYVEIAGFSWLPHLYWLGV